MPFIHLRLNQSSLVYASLTYLWSCQFLDLVDICLRENVMKDDDARIEVDDLLLDGADVECRVMERIATRQQMSKPILLLQRD